MMRNYFIVLLLSMFMSNTYCQGLLIEDLDAKSVEIQDGLYIVVNEASCGLCFTKINEIVTKVHKVNGKLPIFFLYNAKDIPLENRYLYEKQMREILKLEEIEFLFVAQTSPVSFSKNFELGNEYSSPFLFCINNFHKETAENKILSYPELFRNSGNEKKFAKLIVQFFKVKV